MHYFIIGRQLNKEYIRIVALFVLRKLGLKKMSKFCEHQGPVFQSIVSLTSSLRGQLVKCFTTLSPNTLIFFVEKMREAFALQKLLTFFSAKNIGIY